MSIFAKNLSAVRWAPVALASAALWIGAQTLVAHADSEDSRMFYAKPGPGAASLGTQVALEEQPVVPADAPVTLDRPRPAPTAQLQSKTHHPHHRMMAITEHKISPAREIRIRHAFRRTNTQIQ